MFRYQVHMHPHAPWSHAPAASNATAPKGKEEQGLEAMLRGLCGAVVTADKAQREAGRELPMVPFLFCTMFPLVYKRTFDFATDLRNDKAHQVTHAALQQHTLISIVQSLPYTPIQ
jgi:hypothetical protein